MIPHFRTGPVPPVATRRRTCFELLRGMELFSPVADGDLLQLIEQGSERRFETGTWILGKAGKTARNESEAPRLTVLTEGEAAFSWRHGTGGDLWVRTLEAGDFFGQLEVFEASACGSLVRALGPVRAISWDAETLLQAMKDCPALALGFLAGMARQQRHLHRRMAGVSSQRAHRRLARTLTALFEDHGIRLKDAEGRRCLMLQSPPTRRRLGEISGIARETVSRLMGQWELCGWIAESEGDLIIRDERELYRVAGDTVEPGVP